MSDIECTADEGHPCDAGNNGDPCPSCLENEAYWRRQYYAACRPCTLCHRKTPNDDGFCSDECREACRKDY